MIKYKGKTLRYWSQKTGISLTVLISRANHGIRGEALFEESPMKSDPAKPRKQKARTVPVKTVNGVQMRSCPICGDLIPYKYGKSYCPECTREKAREYSKRYRVQPQPGVDRSMRQRCTQEQIDAMLSGDVNALLKAG